MDKIRVTKEFGFEAAHALYKYDGQCANIHGHSYRLFVTVIGQPRLEKGHPKNGMVVDFSQLKQIVNQTIIDPLDHSLILYSDTPQNDIARALIDKGVGQKIVAYDYPPTCEMMILNFARMISEKLPSDYRLHSLRLYETATSYAEWFAEDQQ